jgi:hypothetical protein
MINQGSTNERRLLAWACGLSIVTPVVCWILTVGVGTIPVWLPFVSDMPLYEPAATIFPLGMTLSALLFAMVIPGLYRNLSKNSRQLPGWEGYAPAAASTLLFFAAFSMVIVSHVTWQMSPGLHYLAASGLFLFMLSWGALAEYVRAGGEFKMAHNIRIATILMGIPLLLTLGVLTRLFFTVHQEVVYASFEGRPWPMAFAAVVEWLLVADLSLMMWTWRSEL